MAEVRHGRWEDVKTDQLSATIARTMVWADRLMVARIQLKKGAHVPEHKHENEQITLCFAGVMQFKVAGKEIIVRGGEFLVLPSNVPHEAHILEDTDEFDVFTPPRQDWITGDDAYLRRK
ncbi:MAG: cupin domain-containing protein [Armatimonadetes bacterium]|nr:cupin domain-containing protein [Armatimonadota bacterium]